MDCCGHGHPVAHHPMPWGVPLSSIGAILADEVGPRGSTEAAQTAENVSAALDVLRNSISVDVHSHGGSTGIASKVPPSGDLANAIRAGSLAVACLADVPDWPVLGRSPGGALAAMRGPGELCRYHVDRLAWMDDLVKVGGEWRIRHRRVVNDHLVSDPAKPVNLADPDVAALVQQLIDTADDLARRGSGE